MWASGVLAALWFGCGGELPLGMDGRAATAEPDGGSSQAASPDAPASREGGSERGPGGAPEPASAGGAGAAPMSDGGAGAAGAAAPLDFDCPWTCGGAQPVCDRSRGACVSCTEDVHCPGGKHCDEHHHCLACTRDAHCEALEASHCERSGHGPTCVKCEADAHCDHFPGRPYCSPRGCVQCRPESEASDCGADAPRCNGQGQCVQCTPATEAQDCGGDRPRCESVSQRCVQCTPATEAQDCGGDTPRCNGQGQCVQCTPATEAQDCGAYACDPATLGCTDVERESRLACAPCRADSECAPGLGCVEHLFGTGARAVSTGTFCFPVERDVGCGDLQVSLRPYSRMVRRTSVSGHDAAYCLPHTSCQAISDALSGSEGDGAKPCSLNDDCGLEGLEDGRCLEQGPASGKCSYLCADNYDCPLIGFTHCSNKPGLCVLP